MDINGFLRKFNTITLVTISLIISLLTEFTLLFLTTIFEGKIKYVGYALFIINKDLLFVSFKTQKKINLLKNTYICLLIIIVIYFPVLFYTSFINFKNSYTFFLFIVSVIVTSIFHFLLIMVLNNFVKKYENKENNQSNEELIEEEIKRAMINE